jgi:hypothetical protein
MLTVFLIFKGAQNWQIACEFITFPVEGKYACQPKVWMDEEMMNYGLTLFCRYGKTSMTQTIPPFNHPSSYLMPTMCIRWVRSWTKSSQWG